MCAVAGQNAIEQVMCRMNPASRLFRRFISPRCCMNATFSAVVVLIARQNAGRHFITIRPCRSASRRGKIRNGCSAERVARVPLRRITNAREPEGWAGLLLI
jgi:hypothetical protein